MRKLEIFRRKAGFSRKRLAFLVGCNAQSIYRWERTERVPNGKFLAKFANVFECSIEDLIPE